MRGGNGSNLILMQWMEGYEKADQKKMNDLAHEQDETPMASRPSAYGKQFAKVRSASRPRETSGTAWRGRSTWSRS